MIALWLIRDQLEGKFLVLFGGIAVVGWTLNFLTIRKLNQIGMFQSGRDFLVQCIRALKYFVTAFLVTVQLAGFFVMPIGKSMKAKSMDGFTRWLINHTFDGIDQYPSDKLRPDILYPKNQVTD